MEPSNLLIDQLVGELLKIRCQHVMSGEKHQCGRPAVVECDPGYMPRNYVRYACECHAVYQVSVLGPVSRTDEFDIQQPRPSI